MKKLFWALPALLLVFTSCTKEKFGNDMLPVAISLEDRGMQKSIIITYDGNLITGIKIYTDGNKNALDYSIEYEGKTPVSVSLRSSTATLIYEGDKVIIQNSFSRYYTREFTIDKKGRVLTEKNGDFNVCYHTYDSNGNMIQSSTDSYSYPLSVYDRMPGIFSRVATPQWLMYAFFQEYDVLSKCLSNNFLYNEKGKLDFYRYSYSYDERGFPESCEYEEGYSDGNVPMRITGIIYK